MEDPLKTTDNLQNKIVRSALDGNSSMQQYIQSLDAELWNIEQEMRDIGYDTSRKSGFIKIGSKEDIELQRLERSHSVISSSRADLIERLNLQNHELEGKEYKELKSVQYDSNFEIPFNGDRSISLNTPQQHSGGFQISYENFHSETDASNIYDIIINDESGLSSITEYFPVPKTVEERAQTRINYSFLNTLYRAMKIRDMKNLAKKHNLDTSKVQDSLSDKGAGIFSDIFSNDGLDKQYYRKFSLDLHPDKGGSSEAMQDLNNIYHNGSVKREEKRIFEIIDTLKSNINLAVSCVEKANSVVVIGHEIGNLTSLIQKEFNGEQISVREQISGAASQVKIYNAASSLYNGGSVYTFGLGVDAIADGVYFGYSAFQNDHSEFITAKGKFLTSLNYSVATSISHGATLSTTATLGVPLLGKVAIVTHGTSYATGLLKSYTHSWIGEGGNADYCVSVLDNTVKTIAWPIIFTTDAISISIATVQGELGWLDEDISFQNHIRGLEISKALNDYLSWMCVGFIYDFEQDSKWYQNKIEKANELESDKRRFAKLNVQKLYNGIYKPALEKKYALINSGTSVEDAKEWMESRFKTNVTVKAPEVGGDSEGSKKYLYKYDMCFEMNSYEHGKLYHCYSKSANTVDSVFAGSQYDQSEVIYGYIEYTNIHLEM
ncbi:hypothetical protein Cyrtocomes_01064 [Candidatus Cyrtobacter comes]|uniref:J domain-containing protein n=1 Tax=Candidatus Cyrtobacter comes TaxID=675776 RepID=A0ABU5L974_9RICK|nr:hypothetical protein [Candidatus Cyrtobacter comes]MDZ5762673.1 hypothetical protein [Candidatus Cyrtobacter comes]